MVHWLCFKNEYIFAAFVSGVLQFFFQYDVTGKGKIGGGGEYNVQIGFGWTNGVILELLNQYGSELSVEGRTWMPFSVNLSSVSKTVIITVSAVTLVAIVLVFVFIMKKRQANKDQSPSSGGYSALSKSNTSGALV